MATEFLLTFLAVLVQLGLPVRQQQGLPGKESESRFAIYRLAALSWVQRVGCASLASCMLSLSLSSAQESGPMSGLAYCAGLAVYQGALNPARALGPAVVANRYFLRDLITTLSLFSSPLLKVSYKRWRLHWIFWVGPGLGGATAALTHQLIFVQVT